MEEAANSRLYVNVDEYLRKIGEFGKRQIILQVLFCLMTLPPALQGLLLVFAANNPPWKCTGRNTECNITGNVFTVSHDFYKRRCDMVNRSSWEFSQPRKFSIVTEVSLGSWSRTGWNRYVASEGAIGAMAAIAPTHWKEKMNIIVSLSTVLSTSSNKVHCHDYCAV